ncbi:MAG TPA: RNA polymerase sigma factor SigJ [Thermoanaerobaculia bacterium]
MSEFEAYRALLFSIAYRMTGSAMDAEDLVQDAWLRFNAADRDVVRDVKAFLVTILTRLALDRLKSAQVQREEYIGPWMPEPVFTGDDADAYGRVAREERIEIALLRALERLNPTERAVLLLAEVLEHDHNEIAEMLGITAASSRQILHRAKERVMSEKRRFEPSRDEQRRLVEGFLDAMRAGNVDALRQVLAGDVVARADGAGLVGVAKREMSGVDDVTRYLFGVASKAPKDLRVTVEEINGVPGAVLWFGENFHSVITFEFAEGRITEVSSIIAPTKLRYMRRQLAP